MAKLLASLQPVVRATESCSKTAKITLVGLRLER